MTRLKCIFMGTPELAVPALQKLAAMTDVIRVVTQPDRPAGRGKQLRPPPVKVAAQELNIPVWQPETLRGQEAAEEIQGADFFIVMAYGEILRQAVLDLPKINCINLHCSLLPRWRGASPLQAAIKAGDAATGVSVMKMYRALDAGPVYHREQFALDDTSHLAQVHDRLAICAADALAYYLEHFEELEAQEQDDAAVTYCGKLTSEDGHLDFNMPVQDILRWVRAYTPVPGCWAYADDKRMRIHELKPVSDIHLEPAAVKVDSGKIFIGCADGAVELLQLQMPGKRKMSAQEFLNGQTIHSVIS